MSIIKEHLVIIFDKRPEISTEKLTPKKYACLINEKTKQQAIDSAKKIYESKYRNFNYESFYFEHEQSQPQR